MPAKLLGGALILFRMHKDGGGSKKALSLKFSTNILQ